MGTQSIVNIDVLRLKHLKRLKKWHGLKSKINWLRKFVIGLRQEQIGSASLETGPPTLLLNYDRYCRQKFGIWKSNIRFPANFFPWFECDLTLAFMHWKSNQPCPVAFPLTLTRRLGISAQAISSGGIPFLMRMLDSQDAVASMSSFCLLQIAKALARHARCRELATGIPTFVRMLSAETDATRSRYLLQRRLPPHSAPLPGL